MKYNALVYLIPVCSLVIAMATAQTARLVPEDAEVKRKRACLWGDFKVNETHSISIRYLDQNAVTKIELGKKDEQLVTVFTRKNYCVSKIVANDKKALIMIDYQENWALWSRALLLMDYSEETTCDIKWFLTSEPTSSLGELDIGFDPRFGFCFKRRFPGTIDAVEGLRLTEGKSNWYSLNGLSVNYQSSKLKEVGVPSMESSEGLKIFVPSR